RFPARSATASSYIRPGWKAAACPAGLPDRSRSAANGSPSAAMVKSCAFSKSRKEKREENSAVMKRILILGVNGFIGHHLSKRILAETDWDVYGMDMQTDRIEDLLEERRFHFFEG